MSEEICAKLLTVPQNCVWAIKKIANLAYGNIFPDEEEVFLKGY